MTTFALDLSKQIEAAKAKTELVAKKTMIELFNRVIQKSPVDTGRFRANWNCSIDRQTFQHQKQPTRAEASHRQGQHQLLLATR